MLARLLLRLDLFKLPFCAGGSHQGVLRTGALSGSLSLCNNLSDPGGVAIAVARVFMASSPGGMVALSLQPNKHERIVPVGACDSSNNG